MLQLEFGPGHQVWQYLERGVQIVVGVSAVSAITFLGEVWGSENVPYEAIFIALWWLAYGFLVALLPTPLCWALVPVLGQPTEKEPRKRGILQWWAIISLIGPLVVSLWMFTYAAQYMIFHLAQSQGVDYSEVDLFEPDLGENDEDNLPAEGTR